MMLLIFFVRISKCFWSVCLLFIYFINEMIFIRKVIIVGTTDTAYILSNTIYVAQLIESKERRKLGKVKSEDI